MSRKKRESELDMDIVFLSAGGLKWSRLLRWRFLSVVGCGGGGQSGAAIAFAGGGEDGRLMSRRIDSNSEELPPDVTVPVVLDLVVCSPRQSLRDRRPSAIFSFSL